MRAKHRGTKRPHPSKPPKERNGQVKTPVMRPAAAKAPSPLTRTEHLHGLWVTLGLADVTD